MDQPTVQLELTTIQAASTKPLKHHGILLVALVVKGGVDTQYTYIISKMATNAHIGRLAALRTRRGTLVGPSLTILAHGHIMPLDLGHSLQET